MGGEPVALQSRVERIIETIKNGGPKQREETTKFQEVVPILRELGWDIDNDRGIREVQFEYEVGDQRDDGQVDIALLDRSLDPTAQTVCLIEVKASSERLENHVEQLLGYAFHDAASICALTNGVVWWLYLPRGEVAVSDRRFAELNLLTDDVKDLCRMFRRYLSRDALFENKAERAANEAVARRQETAKIESKLPDLWARMTGSEPDPALVKLVQRRLLDEERLDASAQQVAAAIAGKPIPPAQSTVRSSVIKPSSGNRSEAGRKAYETRAKNPKPVAAEVLGVRIEVRTWKDLYRSVIAFLYGRYQDRFFDAADQVLGGRTRPATSTDPSAYFVPHEVGSTGVFVEIEGNSAAMERRSRQLVGALGHAPADLVIHLAE